MAFAVRSKNSYHYSSRPLNQTQSLSEKIDQGEIKLQNYKEHFLYYPYSSENNINNFRPKNTKDYLNSFNLEKYINKPEYDKDEIIYDAKTKKWVIVKESELNKYI